MSGKIVTAQRWVR